MKMKSHPSRLASESSVLTIAGMILPESSGKEMKAPLSFARSTSALMLTPKHSTGSFSPMILPHQDRCAPTFGPGAP